MRLLAKGFCGFALFLLGAWLCFYLSQRFTAQGSVITTLATLINQHHVMLKMIRYSIIALFIASWPKWLSYQVKREVFDPIVLKTLGNRWYLLLAFIVFEILIVHNGLARAIGYLIN